MVGIRIRTIIINIKIIIIRVIVIIINIEAITIVTIGVIKIGGVITFLKNKKKRISIKIKGLKGTLA